AEAPAASAMRACSLSMTSMMTPPLSICASPVPSRFCVSVIVVFVHSLSRRRSGSTGSTEPSRLGPLSGLGRDRWIAGVNGRSPSAEADGRLNRRARNVSKFWARCRWEAYDRIMEPSTIRERGGRTEGVALPLMVDRHLPTPLPDQLTQGLRRLIAEGALLPGDAVPSSRRLAAHLGISRGSVETAYGQL